MKWLHLFSRICILGLVLATGIQLTGCFEYDERIEMNEDGSGRFSLHYGTEKAMKFQHLYFPVDEYEVRYNIEKNYKVVGVRPVEYQLLRKDDETHVYMNFLYNSLAALNSANRFRDEEFVRIVKGGQITLQRFIYLDPEKLEKSNFLLRVGLRNFFQNEVLHKIKFRFQWIVPGEIVKSNATVLLDKNCALWIYTLADLVKNESTQMMLSYQPKEKPKGK